MFWLIRRPIFFSSLSGSKPVLPWAGRTVYRRWSAGLRELRGKSGGRAQYGAGTDRYAELGGELQPGTQVAARSDLGVVRLPAAGNAAARAVRRGDELRVELGVQAVTQQYQRLRA